MRTSHVHAQGEQLVFTYAHGEQSVHSIVSCFKCLGMRVVNKLCIRSLPLFKCLPPSPLSAADLLWSREAEDEYITHTMPLETINEDFDLLHEGMCLRCVVYIGN